MGERRSGSGLATTLVLRRVADGISASRSKLAADVVNVLEVKEVRIIELCSDRRKVLTFRSAKRRKCNPNRLGEPDIYG
jgi:hypothetical protein